MGFFNRALTLIISISLICLSTGSVQAAMISTAQIVQAGSQDNERQVLLQVIHRADVQQQMASMGVSSADIESRIATMTQQELGQLNQQISDLPAGGSVLGIILTLFIVFVITDAVGATDIFPFVHSVNK
jgi:hypothetical protein